MPNDATFTKNLDTCSPRSLRNVTRPASSTRVLPSRRERAASDPRVGTPSVRRKSPPVPLGSTPNSALAPSPCALARSIPFATSEIVPSPPHAMIKLRPARASRSAISDASPPRPVNATANAPK